MIGQREFDKQFEETSDEVQIRRLNARVLGLIEELKITYRYIDRTAAPDHHDHACCVCQGIGFQPDRFVCTVHRARAFLAEREQRRRGVR